MLEDEVANGAFPIAYERFAGLPADPPRPSRRDRRRRQRDAAVGGMAPTTVCRRAGTTRFCGASRTLESGRRPNTLGAMLIVVSPGASRRRACRDDARRVPCRRAGRRPRGRDRLRPADGQGALPADADRALRGMDSAGRPAVRSVDPPPCPARRPDRPVVAAVDGRSAARSPTGRRGPVSRSRTAASTSRRRARARSRSTATGTRASTSTRTSGSSTTSV